MSDPVVTTSKSPFSRLFGSKPNPDLDYVEGQGFDRKKAKRVLDSYEGDVNKALGKLRHDTHATDADGKPLDNFPYAPGCAICAARAANDAAAADNRAHDPTHIFWDTEKNRVQYREGCDICARISSQGSQDNIPVNMGPYQLPTFEGGAAW
ncbi:hypothetical protein Q8F55_005148 [Vanrija albida]|uniref:UBA domain-containing protein n=1 Tax=Vanrija albida TaxID=181172 RepID=A0ABR3Q0U3_9TREE